MKERTRRIVLFAIIVITGSVMILFDVPLILMIPLVILVGFIILFVLGAITLADIKSALSRPKPAATPKPSGTPQNKGSIFERIKNLKLTKRDAGSNAQTASKPEKKPDKKEPVKIPEKKSGVGGHISSFISSVKSIGTILQARSKTQRKVGDINKQLDKTVNEKIVKNAAPAIAAPSAGGPGAGSTAAPATEADPFLSLSDDEFDPGLLDGLDDSDFATPPQGPGASPEPSAEPGSELPDPTAELDAATNEILKAQGEGSLDEFSGLEGGDAAMDAEFGDLENISLDDMDVDADLDGEDLAGTPEPAAAPAESPAAPAPGTPSPDASLTAVKTAWIPSDAPKGADQMEDQISTQSDMAAFASGSGSDEDMLSSLASDVKRVEKKVDISLVRELKDFKAPANEIEKELDDMYKKIGSVKNTQEKKTDTPPKNGMK
ncbi:hypothetical protein [uncultured Methanoregula sp.]|uniref:hypothetical protein n=1 Tax=uncultured Methanoregula sp. TaxID=1005933 RepID=UPI002AAB5436|nr:hypothetical protein [uncultured Methanoregula sp.]